MNGIWKFQRTFAPGIVALGILCFAPATRAADTPAPAAAPAATNAPAAPAVANSGRARIAFATNVYDFGTVKQGEVVKHNFIFTNTGNATLEILDVKPGCGCTTAGTWDKRVEPGKTGSIPLQFNSAGFGGKVSKSATVTCNDSNTPTLFLSLSGTVWKPIDVTPTMAMFNYTADEQTNQVKTLKIVNNLDEAIQLTNITCTSPSFKTELKTVKEGKEFELEITAVPPFNSPTVFGNISIKTTSPKAPVISATAYAVVQPLVQVFPQQVSLPAGRLTNTYSSQVSLRNNSTNLMKMTDPVLDIPGAEVKLTEGQPGRQFTLQLTLPSGLQLTNGQRPEIVVKTDNPKQPVIKVPILQQQAVSAASAKTPAAAPAKVSSAARVVPTRAAVNPPAVTQ